MFLLLMMMMWMEVTAIPSSSSPSLSSSRQNSHESLDMRRLLCLLVKRVEGRDGSTCESYPPLCTCVPAWQCRDEGAAEEASGNILSLIVLKNIRCGVTEEVCCVQVDENAPPSTPPLVTPSCGQRNLLGVGSTFEGLEEQQSQYGEFPWTAVVFTEHLLDGFSFQIFTAGGSLVHKRLVLTVAHAVQGFSADQLNVRLGEWNTETETEAIPHQDLEVVEVLLHPDYSGGPRHHYDVALLVLKQPVVLGTTVSTVCLPAGEEDYLPDGCVMSGWGKKNFDDSSKFQEVMKAVEMPLVQHDVCQAALQETRLGPGFLLHDSFLCAGGQKEGQDSCTGDGGSPLVCPLRSDPSRYVQVGVVAMGVGCGQMGVPGVYADVLNAQPWINEVIATKFSGSENKIKGIWQIELHLRNQGSHLPLLMK
ncbi:phenoloxidase-activating factor 2-like [Portunus trituberculatus]|uniref:phenoloxidase-activating factor 2-like n=1 Tax=Portunus trituberculatus TaxID=210409 RepID=UPI001E1CD353|nr:phenoloxidase-activating factor 2-like [Portunus trituberculatus]